MIPNIFSEKITLKDGRVIEIETGKLARQADGSVVVKCGGTTLLATVVSSKDLKEGIDFFPLTVDYREKFSSAGKFPGGYFKREGKPSDHEVLTMRLVDRVLRPIFPNGYHYETQVMIQLLSYDETVQPDPLAGLAASAAIAVSDIPFDGPISEVRVVRKNGEHIVNPSLEQTKEVDLDVVVGASKDSVIMVEGESLEVTEQELIEAIKVAHEAIVVQIDAQLSLAEKCGATPKRELILTEDEDLELKAKIRDTSYDKFYSIAKTASSKHDRSEAISAVKKEFTESLSEEELEEKSNVINKYFKDSLKEAVRDLLLEEKIRLDGRSPEEIRPIWCETDYLPVVHGSAIFTRGETQSLTTVTLGSSLDSNKVDGVSLIDDEKFYLHYNFPPFSTGEARPIRGVSRREVGHGNLAQRALKSQIPSSDYTVRVVSEILESNGSSSMATVCAGTMALMDAGIKIKKHVSGIAMGLIINEETGKYVVLSDILGDEDHLGDMDFKITGTKDGITACQMDIKVKGISFEILENALMQAKDGRFHIIDKLVEAIPGPREEPKPNVPRLVKVEIKGDQIGAVIGPGGKIIQEIQAETGTTISIEETEDGKGIVEIFSENADGIKDAVKRIKEITFTPEVGATYKGKVKSIMPFGAFVQIAKGTDGLVHISELEWARVENVEDVVKEGDEFEVKLIGIDEKRGGKLKLSRKALLPKPVKEGE